MIISAFAIIENNEHAILLSHRRDRDLWNLPGGGVEMGESPWDAVIREVREETGLEVAVKRTVGVYYKPDHDELAFSFLCEVLAGSLTETSEADKHEWFGDLPSNTSKRQAERIADYRKAPQEFTFKTHSS